jgi:hypothetical protein
MYSGEPYVAFPNVSNGTSYSPSVQRWNGTSWVYVGAQQTVNHRGYYVQMAIAPVGSPTAGRIYLSFEDFTAGNKLTVLEYNGVAWSYLGGSAGISAAALGLFAQGYNGHSSIAVDGTGQVYVSYSEPSNAYQIVVKKWNGTIWSNVDTAGILAHGAFGRTSLAINPINNNVILSNSGNLKILEWNGTAWTSIGQFSNATYPQLAFDGLGNLFSAVSSVFGFSIRQFFP